jgi:lactate 2-monooxygenase
VVPALLVRDLVLLLAQCPLTPGRPRSNTITLSLLARAKAAGFSALVVTLDTMLLGWRPHDLDTAYLPFLANFGTAVGLSDPVFMATQGAEALSDIQNSFPLDMASHRARLAAGEPGAKRDRELGLAWLAEVNSGTFRTWADVAFLRESWDGPLVLKGIQCVADAHAAMDARADGIVVSNHGGRQVDGAVPSFFALEQICADARVRAAQEAGTFTVLFDSGIRSGPDVIKALAMGAQSVLGELGRATCMNVCSRRRRTVGRPMMYGLAIAGQTGVEEVLRALLADTEISLGLSGYKNIEEIWGKRDEVITRLDWLA